MRDIIFRGKDNFGNWQYGVPVIYGGSTATMFDKVLVFGIVVEAETIGQFTGLTDKNGKKIFEGDILSFGFEPFVVKWDNDNVKYMLYNVHGSKRDGFNVDTMQMKEVIGNIHDNPELLKGGKMKEEKNDLR